jgi:predicted O-linked N-acetylglucosamine transferase (SPINDLY family)
MGTQAIAEAYRAAVAHHHAGRLVDAHDLCREILAAAPEHADALNLLSDVAYRARDFELAADLAGRAVAAAGGVFTYHNSLGNALAGQGKVDEAITSFRRAILLGGDGHAQLHFNLGNACRIAGRLDDAIASYRTAVQRAPGFAEAWGNLGATLLDRGESRLAIEALHAAAGISPGDPRIAFNLGNAYMAAGQLDEAAKVYRGLLAVAPDHAETWINLGHVEIDRGEPAEAEACFRRAIEIAPDRSEAYVALAGMVAEGAGEAVAHRRAVLEMNPDLPKVRSSLLVCMHYGPDATIEELRREHFRFGELHARPLAAKQRPHSNVRDAEKRLKVGFVSADFRFHAIAFLILPLLRAPDPGDWEAVCYSNTRKGDDWSEAWRSASDLWRDVSRLDDAELAETIRADGIDVLIDLGGHAPGNRLLTFARKPAPVQAGWMYVNTRGFAAMDYLIADRVHLPEGEGYLYAECVVRMPNDYACFAPAPYAPPVNPAPSLANGHVTFGSFSELTKITPDCVALWAAVLDVVPGSRFVLNNFLLGRPAEAERLHALFAAAGIPEDRYEFLPGGPHEAFLADYAKVDVVLDTWPYSGGLTTCEALWQGVPTVTLKGDRFCGRHSASHLTAVGLDHLVALDRPGFVDAARRLSGNTERLSALRQTLRERVRSSPLGDVEGFAADFSRALRTMWKRACDGTAETEPRTGIYL